VDIDEDLSVLGEEVYAPRFPVVQPVALTLSCSPGSHPKSRWSRNRKTWDKTPVDKATTGYRQLLRLPDMRALLVAACLSRLAGGMFGLSIVLYVLDRYRSPVLAGWVIFTLVAPGLIVSPLAGAWLDRMGPARAIVLDMAASALLILALAAAGLADMLTVPLLLVLVTLLSLTSPLSSAGVRVLLPRLVPPASLDRANALDTTSYAAINVVGPAIAGLLFATIGAAPSLFTIAALYMLAALSLAAVAHRPSPASGPASLRERKPVMHEAIDGVAHVLSDASLRGLAISYALYMVSMGIVYVAVPAIVVRQAGAEGMTIGGLWALSGAAAAAGALAIGHLRTDSRERLVMAVGMSASAVAIWPVTASFGLVGLAMGLACIGFFSGPIDVGLLSLRQRRTDPARLGRVLAVSISLNASGFPLGSALGGLLIVQSTELTFAVAAAISILAAIAAYALIPRR
jgi:predicted MFS family arabinose efflux permease